MNLRSLLRLKSLILDCFLSISMVLLCPHVVHSQLNKLWELNLPGDGTNPFSYNINSSPLLKSYRTSDGNSIVLGAVKNGPDYLNQTIYVFKHDPYGQIIWEYTYTSQYHLSELINDISMDANGNVILAGKTTTYFSGGFELEETSNALLLKISPQGILLWSWESDPPANNIRGVQECSTVIADQAGNIYSTSLLIDENGAKPVLQKWNADGELVWEKGLEKYFVASLTIVDTTLVLIFSGSQSYLYHYSQDGDLLYSKKVPRVVGIKPVFDQSGNWYNFSIASKFKIEKLNSFGDSLWSYHKPTNLPSNVSADELTDCYVDGNGNVYVTGRYYGPYYGDTSIYTNCDILTAKLNAQGEIQWENIYRSNNIQSCETGERIQVDNSGNTYVAGYQSVRQGDDPYASYKMVLLVYDPLGNRIDSIYYEGSAIGEDHAVNIILDNDAIYLSGWSQQIDGLYDHAVIKYANLYSSTDQPEGQIHFEVFPNPIDEGRFSIRCAQEIASVNIYDITGRLLFSEKNLNGNSLVRLPPGFSTGLYILSINTAKGKYSQSIVISKA